MEMPGWGHRGLGENMAADPNQAIPMAVHLCPETDVLKQRGT